MLFMYHTIQPNVCRLLISSQLPFVSGQLSYGFFFSRKLSSGFRSPFGKMNCGQDRMSGDSSYNSGTVNIKTRTTNSWRSCNGIDRRELSPDSNGNSPSSKHGSFKRGRRRNDLRLEQRTEDVDSSKVVKKNKAAHVKRSKPGQSNSKPSAGANHVEPFDICLSSFINSFVVESLHDKEENGDNVEHPVEDSRQGVLRPGMVLLKHYISHNDQVEIVNTCRELGLGQGGFYRPGYKDGAKLRLQMMCLGLNWDPETRKYEDQHPIDGSKPPCIPHEFNQLVKTAIQGAHALIGEDFTLSNVEDVLPAMSPDICIVNFYTTSGRLGLHQDRDETRESLDRGLPVVSFSIGDSAEFLYGDQRDVDKADKIVLESGDVLIFGGQSRHIFHGVTSIIPNSAPRALMDETRLRPGRLNLTFRRY